MPMPFLRFTLPLLVALTTLLTPLSAQKGSATSTSASVELTKLRRLVVSMGEQRGVRLRHPAAIRNPDTTVSHDVLRYWVFVPQNGELIVDVEPHILRGSVSIVRRGSYGGEPMAMLTIDPFLLSADGRMICVDSVRVHVRWTEPLVNRAYRSPPTTGPVLNPTWGMLGGGTRKKHEQLHADVDPGQWYDPAQPHVRLETTRNGVAYVTASSVLSVEPALRGTPHANLRLFWRGREQHLHLIDADGDNIVSESDTVVFLGMHPRGDTTYLDLVDSTAVFFLTRRATPTEFRFKNSDTVLSQPVTLSHVRIHERFEVDSGYYHPGSGINEDYSTFLTPMSPFEGFYWYSLNARARQAVSLQIPFTPAEQSSFTLRADVVASTYVRTMNPDHGIDVRINGGTSQRVEGDGFQRYLITTDINSGNAPAVTQSMRIYASGVPGASDRPEWFSEVLVDAVEVQGAAAPVLSGGRLRGTVTVPTGGAQLTLRNVGSSSAIVLDTTTWTLYRPAVSKPEITVRTGASRSNAAWIDDQEPDTWDIAIAFNDQITIWGAANGFAIAIASASGTQYFQTSSADSVVDLLSTMPRDAVASVVAAGVFPTQRLIQALANRNTMLTSSDSLWTWTGGVDMTYQFRRATSAGFGSISHVDVGWSARGSTSLDLPEPGEHYLIIGSDSGLEQARVRPSRLMNLRGGRDTLAQSNVIVVAHANVRAAADRWAKYRSKASNLSIRVVDVDAIFDEYDAGRHSPESMRAFLADVWNASNTKQLTHALLFGSASWDVRAVLGGSGRPSRPDLVPTYGRPSSDYWFGLLDDPNDVAVPELIVARFPVLTLSEAHAMIDKIIDHDTAAYAPADRTALYVGGGETEDEGLCQIYQDLLGDVFGTGIQYTETPLCIDTLTVCKSLNTSPGLDIRRHLTSGVGMMNYIGHGGTEVFDIEGWDPSSLANTRFPVMATFSCLTGAFSNPTALCRNGQYLVEPSRGVVAAMGATGWQYKIVIAQLHIDQHEVLRTTTIRDVGRLMYAMKRGFGEYGQQFATNAVLQFNLLGDPFTRVRIDTLPELSIDQDRVVITSPSGSRQLREDDRQATVSLRIWNEGVGTDAPFKVRVRRTYRGIRDSSTVTLSDGICRDATVTVVLDIVEKVGEHTIEVELDPDGVVGDRRENNIVRTSIQVFAKSLLVLEPGEYQLVRPSSVRMRLLDVVSTPLQAMSPNVRLTRSRDTADVLVASQSDEFVRRGSVLEWVPSSASIDQVRGDVWIAAWAVDEFGRATTITWVPMTIADDAPDDLRHFQIAPTHMLFGADSVALDSSSRMLGLSSYIRDLYVRSHGSMTADPDRDPILEVRIADSVIVRSAFRTGLNVMTVRASDTVPYRVRRFDTSPVPAPASSHNGFARECINFLRDSVSDRDRVIVAACDESFTRFVSDNLFDDLRRELKRLGARMADSLAIASSYALVGSRTAQEGFPMEQWKAADDGSVTLDTTLPITYATVQVSSPVIGPVRSWSELVPQVQGDVRGKLIGVRNDLSEVVLDTTGSLRPGDVPDDVIALQYRWSLRDGEEAPRVGVLNVTATPLPQWIIEPTAMTVTPQDVIRGDTTMVCVRIVNPRRTEQTPEAVLRLDIVDASTMIPQPYVNIALEAIPADSERTVDVPVSTLQLPSMPMARATLVVSEPIRQRFAVRDRCEQQISLARDTMPPTIEAYVSGRQVRDGDQVPSMAHFDVRILDNARLPITDPENVIIFINGIRIRSTSVSDYEFIATDSAQKLYPGTNVRALVRFTFPMEQGENLLIVRATDAFQNSDTLELSLYPVTELVVTNAVVMPNPTSGAAVLRAEVVADEPELQGRLIISDAQGRLVRSLRDSFNAAAIEFLWDGRSQQDESCASGPYYWRLEIQTSSGSVLKTVAGTLLILR